MLFVLAASNGRPMWTSSGLFVAILAPIMILGRGLDPVFNAAVAKGNRPIFLGLVLFLFANLLSTVATPTDEAVVAVVLRCLLPLFIYLAMVGLALRSSDVSVLILGLAAGCAVIFARGLAAYIGEWGVPDLKTAMWARFNVERMAGYADATLGNVGHMGSYVVLVVPPMIFASIVWVRSNAARLALILVAGIGITNLVLSGSRAGLAILLLSAVMITLSLGVSRAVTVSVAFGALVLITMPDWIDQIADPEVIRRYLPSSTEGFDKSAEERIDSILLGWQTFLDNPLLGVGPDMSREHNYYTVPHASIVHQLSELGVIGGTVFIWLNVVVLAQAASAMFRAGTRRDAAGSLLWLMGPACWLILGIVAGITFNSSFALVWIGIAHAMLALSGAHMLSSTPARAPGLRRPE